MVDFRARFPVFLSLVLLFVALPFELAAQTAHFSYAQLSLTNGFNAPAGVAVDANGNIYVADTKNNAVEEIAPGCILASCTVTLGSGFSGPSAVAVDAAGNVYVVDTNNHAVKEILAVNGSIPASPTINTLGSGFSSPVAIAVDKNHNVFVADSGNATVKEIVAAGGYTTVTPLGSGYATPSGLAVDANGDVFVTDSGNNLVEELVAVSGTVPASPTIKSLGSGFLHPAGVAVDASGNVLVADTGNSILKELVAVSGTIPSSPTITSFGIGLSTPMSLALGAHGTIYTTDAKNNAVIEEATQAVNFGSVAQYSQSGTFSFVFTFDSGGQIGTPGILAMGAGGKDFIGSSTGTTCTANATFTAGATCILKAVFIPRVVGQRNGAVVLYDTSSPGKVLSTVYVDGIGVGAGAAYPPGTITSAAGNGTQGFVDSVVAASAELNGPSGIAFDGSLNLYVADTANQRVRVVNATTGLMSTFAGGGTGCSAATNSIGDGCPATSATLASPGGVAVDGAGNVFIADTADQRIRLVNASTGVITTVTGGGSGCSGQTDSQGDGCAAASAKLSNPAAVAVDGFGNLYISDTGNNSVRVVNNQTGLIAAVASIPSPAGLAIDSAQNVYVADPSSSLVHKVNGSSGALSNFAGGGGSCSGSTDSAGDGCPATNASLSTPNGIAIDPAGNVYISDSGAKNVRVVNTSTGFIALAAGGGTGCSGQSDSVGDGCLATSAVVGASGLAMDSLGHLYVADAGNQRIREIDLVDPSGLVFPNTAVGSVSSSMYATLESVGNTPIALNGFGLYGGNFNIDETNSTCNIVTRSLIPGATCLTGVVFQPRALGATSSVVVNINNVGGGQNVPVSGTATPAVPPPAPVIVSEPPAQTTTTYATFTFTDTNPNVNFQCSLDSAPYTPCTSGITYTALGVGDYHFFYVEAVDYLGNTSPGTEYTWAVDNPPPFPVFTNGPPSTTASTTAIFTFTDTQQGVTFLCSLDSAAFTPCTSGIKFTSLTVGAHSFAVEAQASAAVFSGTSTLSWTITPPPPPTPIAAPPTAVASDFGTVVIGQTSTTISIPFTFTLGGVMAAPQVLTQGAANLDFAMATTSTCKAGQNYATGSSCTVDVTFTPKYAGIRYGAVLLQDPYGNTVGTAYLRGIGSGPQVDFPVFTQSSLGGGFGTPYGVAIDGSGSVYVADDTDTVRKIPSGCTAASCTLSIGTNFFSATGVAVDGVGNVFVADGGNGAVKEIPLGCTLDSCIRTLSSAFTFPTSVAVDASGNVFVADAGPVATGSSASYPNGSVSEILAAGGYATVKSLQTGVNEVVGLTVDGNANVFLSVGNGSVNSAIDELSAAGGYSTLKVLSTNFYAPGNPAIDAVGNVYVSDQLSSALKVLTASSNYTTVNTVLAFGPNLGVPYGITLDASGNLFAAVPGGNTAGVYKLDNADSPSLTFKTTSAGSIDTTDGTLPVTLQNIGNAPLTFSALTAPTANFNVVASATTCATSTPLAAGASCAAGIQFAPTMTGTLTNSFTFVDNNLNAVGSTQIINLSGSAEAGGPPPAPTITSEPTNPSGSFNASFAFTDSQAGVTFLCSLDSAAYTPCTSGVGYTLANGTHTFAVRAADSLNNLGAITTYSWTISALPLPAITAAPANPTVASAASFSFTDTLSGGTFVCSLDGAAYAACVSGISYTALAAGAHTFGVEVTNTQNEFSAPATFTWTIASTVAFQNNGVQDFGTVAIGQTSVTIPLTYTFTAAATLGSPVALTEGAPNLDFAITGGTCSTGAHFASGNICTLNVTFTPAFAGTRKGALLLKDSSGNTVAMMYVHGIGSGPEIRLMAANNYGPGSETAIGGGFSYPSGMAVDGSGNVYVADSGNSAIKKIPAGCVTAGCVVTLASGLYDPVGVAVDGAGNVYFSEYTGNLVMEIPAGCTSSSCFINIGGGWFAPDGIAVDGSGNVFVADYANNAVKEIPRGCLNLVCVVTLGSGFIAPEAVGVDPSGNVLVVQYGAGNASTSGASGCNQSYCVGNSVAFMEIPAAGGYTTVKTLQTAFNSPLSLTTDPVGNAYITEWASGLGEVQEFPAAIGYSQVQPLNLNCGSTQGSLCSRGGAAVDASGNVYVSDNDNNTVLKMTYTAPAPLTFATPTTAGSLDYADPPTGTFILNDGNAPLTFTSIVGDANFVAYNGNTPCSTSTPLAPAGLCSTAVAFVPSTSGPITGTLTFTDNNLNGSSVTQQIALSGTGLPPGPTITAYPANDTTATTATFSFTDTVSNSTFLCSLDGSAFTACSSGVTYNSLAVGTHSFSVEDKDSLGNISGANVYSWNILPPAPPEPTIITAPSNPTTSTSATFTFTDSVPGVSYLCYVDSILSGFGACTSGVTYNSLSVGSHTFNILASNQYGASSFLAYSWTIVTTIPPPTPPAQPLPPVTSGNFGTLPIAQTSSPQTLTLTFGSNGTGTIGSIAVLTHGAANLDFQQASGGTCAVGASYTSTTTCTVNATFTPSVAGFRKGAVVINDTSGNLLSIVYLQGVGTGPQVSFLPGIVSTFTSYTGVLGNGGLTLANASADGNGNIYTTSWYNPQVQVIPPGCTQPSCTRALPVFGWGSTVDGAGNLFVAGGGSSFGGGITLVPQGCYFTACQIPVGGTLGIQSANGVDTNGSGDLYIADGYNYNGGIYSTAASGYTAKVAFGAGYSGGPRNVAVDVNGNVFSANYDGGGREIPAGCVSLTCEKVLYTSTTSPISNFMTGVGLDGVGNAYFYSTALSVGTVNESYVSTNYATSSTLPNGTLAEGLGLDDRGNLYLPLDTWAGGSSAPAGTPVTRTLTKIDYNTPPTLTFPTFTPVGTSDTTDGTIIATIKNNGNGATSMTFTGFAISNPSFTFDPASTTCSASAPLAAQTTCTVGVKFAPLSTGAVIGTLTVTDNTLNAPGSTQLITLVGTSTGPSSLAATTTTLQANPQSITAGSSVTFTAHVTSASGTPTGVVTFTNGVSPIGTGTLNGSGIATLTTSALAAGTQSVVANYGGDSANAASASTASNVTVSPAVAPTKTTLALSATSIAVGSAEVFNVTVSQTTGSATPTGTLTLLDGGASIGTGTLNSNGTISFSISTLAVGNHTIQASYGGDAADAKSTSYTITLTVLPIVSTTTSLAASASSAVATFPVTFTATITPASGTITPTGKVIFYDGTAAIGVGTVGAGGVATATTQSLALGTHSITAAYSGDSTDLPSTSSAVSVYIATALAVTNTTLASASPTVPEGGTVSITASVKEVSGTVVPTGTITFLDGTTTLGTGTLNANGAATISANISTLGAHSIKAVYAGDTKNLTSTSTAVTVTASAAPSTTTVHPSATSVPFGTKLVFTASVTSSTGASIPTGTVTFKDGTTTLGTGTLNSRGETDFSTTTLALGTHSITASYAGDSKNSASTSGGTFVSVTSLSTTTTLSASAATIATGKSITFTAAVSPSSGSTIPTGTVTFLDGNAVLGMGSLNSDGIATYSTTTLAIGPHSITASYGGDTNDATSVSSIIAIIVTAPPSPTATLTPPQLTFSSPAGTPSAAQTATLQNTGTVSLTITGITLAGANPGNFTTSTTCGGTLAAGASCTISITFTSFASASYAAILIVADNATGAPQTISLSGTGTPPPAASLSPNPLTFPSTTVNTASTPLPITLSNSGSNPLAISGIAVTGANASSFSQTNNCPASLAANATCTINVTFTPASVATGLTASLAVTDNATGSPQTVTLTGTGTAVPAPVVALAPAALSFPSTTVNVASASLPVTLSNTGNAGLSISSIAIGGSAASSFSQTNNCPASLAANASCTINVIFTPSSVATGLAATLSVSDNATGSPHSIALTGTGTAAPAPIAGLAPASLSFPSTTVNVASTPLPVTLLNTGNAALTVGGITISGASSTSFSQTNNCPASLAANASCTINVIFTPASVTTGLTASLSVADNATGSPQSISLTGTGTAAPAPVVSFAPASLSFPATVIGTASTPLPVTLLNTGNAALTVSTIAIGGAAATSFSQTNNCPSSLAANASCTITVVFKPASVATGLTATLSVTDNAIASPQSISLTGTGTAAPAPIATLSPATLAFPNTVVGATATALPVTLSNTGNATLTGIAISLSGTNSTNFALASGSTCGTTLAAGATCTIPISFTPAAQTAYAATLSVSDNASGSPQTIAITGTGVPLVPADFTLTLTQPTQSVQPGAIAQFILTVGSLNGAYNTPVSLSATGLPTGAIATFAPASVTPGSATATSVLSIQTASLLAANQPARSTPPSRVPLLAALVMLPLLGIRRVRRLAAGLPRLTLLLVLAVLTLLPLAAMTGCSGGYFGPKPQTYTVTITGASGTTQHSTTVTLTVQ